MINLVQDRLSISIWLYTFYDFKGENESHSAPENTLSVSSLLGRRMYVISLTRLPLIRVQCTYSVVVRMSLYFFDTAPPNTCTTYFGVSSVSHEKCPLVSFFVLYIATHSKEHKANLTFQSNNNAALLVATLQYALSFPN